MQPIRLEPANNVTAIEHLAVVGALLFTIFVVWVSPFFAS